jgi:putative insertion element HTH domain-containing protein
MIVVTVGTVGDVPMCKLPLYGLYRDFLQTGVPWCPRCPRPHSGGCSTMKAQTDTESTLTLRQIRTLECLMDRRSEESLEDVAVRAGVSRRTMHRYLVDPVFLNAYRERVELELGAHRGRVAAALVKGAINPGPGQASMQKIYWQRLGELIDARSWQFEDPEEVLSRVLGISKDELPP